MEARGATLLYLPPNSPDLNPIEQFSSKPKALLRKAAARSIDSLWEVIGSYLADFSPSERDAYLIHAGYDRRDGQPYRKNALMALRPGPDALPSDGRTARQPVALWKRLELVYDALSHGLGAGSRTGRS
jgi:hypothetical protein